MEGGRFLAWKYLVFNRCTARYVLFDILGCCERSQRFVKLLNESKEHIWNVCGISEMVFWESLRSMWNGQIYTEGKVHRDLAA